VISIWELSSRVIGVSCSIHAALNRDDLISAYLYLAMQLRCEPGQMQNGNFCSLVDDDLRQLRCSVSLAVNVEGLPPPRTRQTSLACWRHDGWEGVGSSARALTAPKIDEQSGEHGAWRPKRVHQRHPSARCLIGGTLIFGVAIVHALLLKEFQGHHFRNRSSALALPRLAGSRGQLRPPRSWYPPQSCLRLQVCHAPRRLEYCRSAQHCSSLGPSLAAGRLVSVASDSGRCGVYPS
jgi:hypothetical protein